ncbi:hypothetical protein IT568_00330 [bacterium]|nr:hypothetical protein [bacterium]
MKILVFDLVGIDTEQKIDSLTKALFELEGVFSATVTKKEATVEFDTKLTREKEIIEVISKNEKN